MNEKIEAETTVPEKYDLIVVEQLPVITEKLHEIKDTFVKITDESLSMECTTETLQAVKKTRSNLTKVFNTLEEKRKAVKKQIMTPYEEFEKVYKECVSEIYKPCDAKLAEKIHAVEDGIKAEKEAEIRRYYSEYAQAVGIDFAPYETANISVTMSASIKSLEKEAKDFLDKLAADIKLISIQKDADEILVEYKKDFNLSRAVLTVNERIARINAERIAREERERREAEEREKEKEINEIIEANSPEQIEVPEEETPYNPEPVPEATPEPAAEIYEVDFKVIGTIEQIKALKKFLTDGGYKYE